jgi:arginine repressor
LRPDQSASLFASVHALMTIPNCPKSSAPICGDDAIFVACRELADAGALAERRKST